MKLKEIKKILDAEECYEGEIMEKEIYTVCGSDLMSDVLTFIKPKALLLTGLTNPQVIRTAEVAEIAAICFVRGKQPQEATINLAIEKGIPLLKTRYSMFEACGRLYVSGLADSINR